EEIAAIRGWIDAGAHGPSGAVAAKELVVPRILPRTSPRVPINAFASSAGDKLLAVARYAVIELRSTPDLLPVRTLHLPNRNVNALAFLPQRNQLFAAGGQPGVAGEIGVWNAVDGTLIRAIPAHKDAIYALAPSPDGAMVATGSYDQKIKLW